eukprot:206084-Pelagomonas_calceolata.AAC.1
MARLVEAFFASVTSVTSMARLVNVPQVVRRVMYKLFSLASGIPSAGPGGNPFSHLFWLAKEE